MNHEVELLLNVELPDDLLARLAASRGLTIDDLDGPVVQLLGTAEVVEERYIPASWSGPEEGGGCYVAGVEITDAYLDRDPSPCVSDADLMREVSDWVWLHDEIDLLAGCRDE